MDLSDFYVSSCVTCHVLFALLKPHEAQLRKTHALFYCPAGHDQLFKGKTEIEIEIEHLKDSLAAKDRELVALKKRKRGKKKP